VRDRPKTNDVLGTIALGHVSVGEILGPVDTGEGRSHGLDFSRDGRLLT